MRQAAELGLVKPRVSETPLDSILPRVVSSNRVVRTIKSTHSLTIRQAAEVLVVQLQSSRPATKL